MVLLRSTRKLLARLGPGAVARGAALSDEASVAPSSTTLLGDWYANLLMVARRPLVLCVAERSLFAVVVPLKEAATLVARYRQAVERRLLALDVAPAQVAAELAAMADVIVAPTAYGASAGVSGRGTAGAAAAVASDAVVDANRPAPMPTSARRMIGVLTDMAWHCDLLTTGAHGFVEPDIAAMERALDMLPCKPIDYRGPSDMTRALFAAARPRDDGRGLWLVR